MTKEEFKAEILKANPRAVFIERRNGDLECTETEMLVRPRGSWVTPKEANVVAEFEIVWAELVVYGWSSQGFAKTEERDSEFMAAPKIKKTRRLMTPAECAGKWVTSPTGLSREFVHGYDKNNVNTRGNNGFSPEYMHSHGWTIADTPTSEPYSLEIEE